MKQHFYPLLAVSIFCVASLVASSQSSSLEFISCTSEPMRLSVLDDAVRLPASNQLFLGVDHPEATSCSGHLSQEMRIRATCGSAVMYEVKVFIDDIADAIVLHSATGMELDSSGEAVLWLDTELAVDSVFRYAGLPFAGDCQLYHRIVWTVWDSCGQQAMCETKVQLYDGTPGILATIGGPYSIVSDFGRFYLHAEDLVLFQDDCATRENVLFSHDSLEYIPTLTEKYCEIPGIEIELPYQIWVADQGVDANCDGQISWEERRRSQIWVQVVFLDQPGTYIDCYGFMMIVGTILERTQLGVPHVRVSFEGSQMPFPSDTTDLSGNFKIVPLNFSFQAPAKIVPFRNDNHKEGVSTLDVVRLQKHLLGIEPLNNPYDWIAADANRSSSLSAIDLVELRKLILGIYEKLPLNTSWRFVPKSYNFSDTTQWQFKEYVDFNPFGMPRQYDFIGIKIGDINRSLVPGFNQFLPRTTPTVIGLVTDHQTFRAGDIVEVPVYTREQQSFLGFQFTLAHPGLEFVDLQPGILHISEEELGLFEDHLTMSWFDMSGVQSDSDQPLMTFRFLARYSGALDRTLELHSAITEAEWYTLEDEVLHPVLGFYDATSGAIVNTPVCHPNPWTGSTTITCILPAASDLHLQMFDPQGRLLFSRHQDGVAGSNSVRVHHDDLSSAGLFFYRVTAGAFSASGKMIHEK